MWDGEAGLDARPLLPLAMTWLRRSGLIAEIFVRTDAFPPHPDDGTASEQQRETEWSSWDKQTVVHHQDHT